MPGKLKENSSGQTHERFGGSHVARDNEEVLNIRKRDAGHEHDIVGYMSKAMVKRHCVRRSV